MVRTLKHNNALRNVTFKNIEVCFRRVTARGEILRLFNATYN